MTVDSVFLLTIIALVDVSEINSPIDWLIRSLHIGVSLESINQSISG